MTESATIERGEAPADPVHPALVEAGIAVGRAAPIDRMDVFTHQAKRVGILMRCDPPPPGGPIDERQAVDRFWLFWERSGLNEWHGEAAYDDIMGRAIERRPAPIPYTNGHAAHGIEDPSGEADFMPEPPPADPADYGERAPISERAPAAPRFVLIPFDQLKPAAHPAYLVKGLLPRVGLAVIWGPPKCGKSFWTMDLLLHVALGWEYRGRKVVQGPVVYCAFEGQDGYGKRADAFRQRHLAGQVDPVAFYLVATRMSLVKDHGELIRSIEAQLGETKPAAIALDTLNRSLDGSESDDKDMSAYVRAGDALRERFDCAVVIVHHCGIEGTRPRGHTSLTGAVDAQLAVKRDGAGNVLVTVEWMKDGPEGDTIASRLEPVTVGQDTDGDEISTCVLEPVDASEVRASAPNRKLSDRQRLALDALGECVLSQGKDAPAAFGLPAGVRAVAVEAWRAELFTRGVIDAEAKSPREDYRRVKNSLQARQLIGERDGLIWKAAP